MFDKLTKYVAAILGAMYFCSPVCGQQTQSQNGLNAEINARLPSGQNPGITAANLRQVLFDMVTASFQGFSAAQLTTMLAASNNAAPHLNLYSAASADITPLSAIFPAGGQIYGISKAGNGPAVLGASINSIDNMGGCIAGSGQCSFFLQGLSGYGNINAAGNGNYIWAGFLRADLNNNNGSATGLEVDCNIQSANGPTSLPPVLAPPATGAWCIGIQSANIGAFQASTAFRAVSIGQIGGPSSWVADYYADPPVATGTLYGLFIDGNSSFAPKFGAYIKNLGSANNVALTNQITGSFVGANPVMQNISAAGIVAFQVDQYGHITINSSATTPVTSSPTAPLWVTVDETNGLTLASAALVLDTYSGAAGCVALCAGTVTGRTARGTSGVPVALSTNDIIVSIGGVPCVGGPPCSYVAQQPVSLRAIWTDSGTNQGSAWDFYTSPNGATGNRAFAARVQPSGGFSVGLTTDPGIGGILANKTIGAVPTSVGSLPTCNSASKGFRSFVVDELAAVGFNTIATGSGANNVPVFCDGTNWRIG